MATKAKSPVEVIKAYKPRHHQLTDTHDQLDLEAGTFKPFSKIPKKTRDAMETYEWLDGITLAVEAGLVPKNDWIKFIFGAEHVFFEFAAQYSNYDDEYRTNDRWFKALTMLAGDPDQYGLVRAEEIVSEIATYAFETGQMKLRY